MSRGLQRFAHTPFMAGVVRRPAPVVGDALAPTAGVLLIAGGLLQANAGPAEMTLTLLLAVQCLIYAYFPIYLTPSRQPNLVYVFLLLAVLWLPLVVAIGLGLLAGFAIRHQRGENPAHRRAGAVLIAWLTLGLAVGFAAHGALTPVMPGWFDHLSFVVAMAGYGLLELAAATAGLTVFGDRLALRNWRTNYAPSFIRYMILTTLAMVLAMTAEVLAVPWTHLLWPALLVAYAPVYLYGQMRRQVFETVCSWGHAVDARDPYTDRHSENVSRYAVAIGRELDLRETELERLAVAARLHDIGKIVLPERILQKPGPLTPAEFERIKQHTAYGERFLRPVGRFGPIASIVRHHHECWDGTGYPDGITGEEIPLPSRIIHVADAYEAMTSDRPYRSALSDQEAVQRIRGNAGGQFDPAVVEAFVQAHANGLRDAPSLFSYCSTH